MRVSTSDQHPTEVTEVVQADGSIVQVMPANYQVPRTKKYLGDHTERLLQRVGVTKERYVAAKVALGLAPTCGCDDRKVWLNKASKWLADQLIAKE